MRSFAVLCIIAVASASPGTADQVTQTQYTALNSSRAHGAVHGHLLGETNELSADLGANDCSVTDHLTGTAFTLKLGDSAPGANKQWCNTVTCEKNGDFESVLVYEHELTGNFDCGIDKNWVQLSGTEVSDDWSEANCAVNLGGPKDVSCTYSDSQISSAGLTDDAVTHTFNAAPVKRMVTTHTQLASQLGGHQCALRRDGPGLDNVSCLCLCKTA